MLYFTKLSGKHVLYICSKKFVTRSNRLRGHLESSYCFPTTLSETFNFHSNDKMNFLKTLAGKVKKDERKEPSSAIPVPNTKQISRIRVCLFSHNNNSTWFNHIFFYYLESSVWRLARGSWQRLVHIVCWKAWQLLTGDLCASL